MSGSLQQSYHYVCVIAKSQLLKILERSNLNTPRGQRATHSPHVRHRLSLIAIPIQACLRISIPIGQWKVQSPHWTHLDGSGTTCPSTMICLLVLALYSKSFKLILSSLILFSYRCSIYGMLYRTHHLISSILRSRRSSP